MDYLSILTSFLLLIGCDIVVQQPSMQKYYGQYRRWQYRYRWMQQHNITTTTKQSSTMPSTTHTTPTTVTQPSTTQQKSSTAQQQTNNIVNQYKIVQEITSPKLFGFSREEAESFPSRISELISPVQVKCNTSSLPKYTMNKISELTEILKNNTCSKTQPSRSARAPIGTINENWENTIVQNPDGSVTRVTRCFDKGSLTRNGNSRLCTECQAMTELPNNV
jgi:hypothetical protein